MASDSLNSSRAIEAPFMPVLSFSTERSIISLELLESYPAGRALSTCICLSLIFSVSSAMLCALARMDETPERISMTLAL